MSRFYTIISLIIATLAFGCSTPSKKEVAPETYRNSLNAKIIADTIVYDVILRNIDTSDVWQAECLQRLNQNAFIEYLFDGIYSDRFIATEFMSDKVLSIKDVKDIEKSEGFSRAKVSKVQFRERWYIDSLGVFQKEVLSYTLGLETYSKQNSFLGHKALFVVKPKF
ncbi:MAG: hypothetical protein AB7S48_07755 [Bacteroidales bacterium]